MAQGFHLSQKMALSQVLAPHMRQSLALLQAPTLELRALIEQELQRNPLLEEQDENAKNAEHDQNDPIDSNDQNDPIDPIDQNADSSFVSAEKRKEELDDWQSTLEELSQLQQGWREYFSQPHLNSSSSSESEERHRFMMDSIASTSSLQETLRDQIRTSDLSETQRRVAELLIGNIDDRGYLRASVDELVISTNQDAELIRQVIEVLQSFDPPGIATRNLRECLMKQLDRAHRTSSLEYRILAKCFEHLAKRRLPQIARRLRVPLWEVQEAAERIRHLNPSPGGSFTSENPQYVVPEIFVKKEGDAFVISINKEPIPQLRISNTYKDLLSESEHSSKTREYIREKIRSGKFLIKSIGQRQETIAQIAKEIVKRQGAFFEKGLAFLKPMTMGEIAEVIGVHETTISRAVAGKYLQCAQGIFEMKSFFTSPIHTTSGTDVSNASVKEMIGEMVRGEDPRKPLSDEELTKGLTKRGIQIARRTVAKYRRDLNILPSLLRKTY